MIICLILLYRTSSPDSHINKTMMIVTIILGTTIGFILLTASMIFVAKHTDEIDMLDSQTKENENKTRIKRERNK